MKIVCCWMFAINKYGFPPSVEHTLQAIQEMSDLEFKYIELEGVGFDNLQAVIDHREQIKAALQTAKIKLANFAMVLPEMISSDDQIAERAMQLFEKGAETAVYLGTPRVWIDSYFPPLDLKTGKAMTQEIGFGQVYQVHIPAGFNWPVFWERYVATIKRANQIAKAKHLELLIEPRMGEITSNTDSLLRLMDAVGDENLGVIFDTAHLHAQKELLPLSVEKLGKRIRYIHVSDNDSRMNDHLMPGDGNIDWEEIFLALKRQGFEDGYYATDLGDMPHLEQKFVECKQILERYGKQFDL
jgi:sugar phosphate isomerase/epimerase